MATRLGGTGPAAWPARRTEPPARPPAAARGASLVGARAALGALLAALALAAACQGAASAAAARIVAAAVRERLGGGAVTATVVALPFWQLAQGRFQHLSVRGVDVRGGRLAIAQMRADWRDGRVDVRALEAGRPLRSWVRGGRLVVRLTLGPAALVRALPRTGTLTVTRLSLAPPGVRVYGRLRFDGLDLPFRAFGEPRVVDAGNVLVFLVTAVRAGPFALRSALGVPVVDLRRTALGGALWIQGAHVGRRAIVVVLCNRPVP
jgi:hypothetical protein